MVRILSKIDRIHRCGRVLRYYTVFQGGKMGTYMNRGGGQGPPGGPQFDIGAKLGNLTLDHNLKMMGRQSGPGERHGMV